jgi:flagellar motor protein MotB
MMPPAIAKRRASRYAGQGWMITFVDLMALCVAFFVLLHAMSAPKPQLWSGAARAISERLGGTPVAPSIGGLADDPVGRMHGLLRTRLGTDAPISRLPDRVLITFPAASVVDAEGRPTADGKRLAAQIAEILAPIGSRIDITGLPPAGEAVRRPMQSWRLSFGQANAFAAALSEAGYSRRLAALASGAGGRERRIQIAVFEDKGHDAGA